MSDFYRLLHHKRTRLLAEAIALDFSMWSVSHDRPDRPACTLEALNKLECADLVDRHFFRREPKRRRAATGEDWYQELDLLYREFNGGTDNRRAFQLQEVAKEVGLSPREVRRKLRRLLIAGTIPPTWFNGYKWQPTADEAVRAILGGSFKRHKPHTVPDSDSYADYVLQCRVRADELTRELEETESIRALCARWCRIRRTAAPKDASDFGWELHTRRELRRGYNEMEGLAKLRRWSFCRLFVAIYEPMQRGSHRPVRDAQTVLHMDHAAFYRNYTKREISDALRLAEGLVANPRPSAALSHVCQDNEDLSEVFSGWENKEIPPEEVWIPC